MIIMIYLDLTKADDLSQCSMFNVIVIFDILISRLIKSTQEISMIYKVQMGLRFGKLSK